MKQKVYRYRNSLSRTLECLEKGQITLGFIGGSITDCRSGNRWPEYVINWFVGKFPETRVYVENAAIGATGSDLAVFRAERDLINRSCDIIFVEYAVNDWNLPSEKRMRTREGLIRKLLSTEKRDIIFTYTFRQEMYDDMINNRMPDSIEEFEELAEHYGIGSVWMGLYALEEVKMGRMRWEEWLPDGLHPEYRGSFSYAQSVITYLEKELITKPNFEGKICVDRLPEPLNNMNWGKTHFIPFSEVKLKGPWAVRRWAGLEWIDQVLDTAAVGAKLSFDFKGRGLSLGFDFGKTSADFCYRLDGGKWIYINRERPWWCENQGWFKVENIADDLINGCHVFELEVIHGNREECKGTNFRLAFIGVID